MKTLGQLFIVISTFALSALLVGAWLRLVIWAMGR